MSRYGENRVAGLVLVGRRRFDDEMLLVVQHGDVVGHIEQDATFASRRIAGDGFRAEVEGEARGGRPADDSRQQHGGGREASQVGELRVVTVVVEKASARRQFQSG